MLCVNLYLGELGFDGRQEYNYDYGYDDVGCQEWIHTYIYASFALSFAMDCCDYRVYKCL